MLRLHLFTLLLLTLPARAQTQTAFRVSVLTGYDSNAARDFTSVGASQYAGDLLVSGAASAEGLWKAERLTLWGTYDVGSRLFLTLWSQNTVLQAINTEVSRWVGKHYYLGLTGRAKDRRGAERDYTDGVLRAFVEFRPDAQLSFRLEGGLHRFLLWNQFDYTFTALELGISTRYRLNKNHAFSAFGEWGPRNYKGQVNPRPDTTFEVPARRQDQALTAGVSYQFRGPFTASIQYSYMEFISNSFGESLVRHRLSVNAGLRLPWKFFLMGTGSLQLTHLPDGIFITQQLIIPEDEETHNSVSVKLARPLNDTWDVELRYAVYQNGLQQNLLNYSRQLLMLGLTWRN